MKDREQAILAAVERAKKSNFKATAIKVELEANLNRDGDFYDLGFCYEYIMRRLEPLGLAEEGDEDYIEVEGNGEEGFYSCWRPVAPLRFIRFYNDGSVDSEMTFTLMLDDPKNILLLPKIINVFQELAEANGNGMDVRGAGMHMAWLNSPNGTYPTPVRNQGLGNRRFYNFKQSMTLLLPALFFLGSADGKTRGLGYRRPEIGWDSHRSAIDYRDGALEFRVFDTCYETPDAILDNVVVMSNCLKYWRLNYLSPGMNKVTTATRFGVDGAGRLDNLYVTYTHLDLLNKGLRRIKPCYQSVPEIKKQRGFEKNRQKIGNEEKEVAKEAESTYNEYKERLQWRARVDRAARLYTLYDSARSSLPQDTEQRLSEIEAEGNQAAEQTLRGMRSLSDHIANRLREWRNRSVGDFLLEI